MMLQQDYPVTEICEVLDLPRSTFYHQSTAQDDTALRFRAGIETITGDGKAAFGTQEYTEIDAIN